MKQRLGDYIKEYSVRNKNDEDIPVYSVTNTHGFCKDYFGKEVASKDKTTYKIVPQGCFAYNPSRINVGSVDWQRDQEKVIVSPLYNVFSVSDKLDNQYLYYYLKSNSTLQRIRAVAIGSVRDNLKLDMLFEFPINVYELQIQKEVAYLLDKVKKVMGQKEEELRKLDELIKARFVEMFGDQEFEKKHLIELIQKGAGLSYGIVVPGENVADGIPMVRPSDFKNGRLNLENVYRVASDIECKYKKTRLVGDEILVQVIGQPGQVMLSDERCKGMNVTRNLAVIRIDNVKVNRIYISHYLTTEEAQRFMFGSTNQSTLKQLPLNKLKELPVPLAPLSEQEQFADFVKQVDKSKVAIQKSLEKTQLLFDSLMQKYFG